MRKFPYSFFIEERIFEKKNSELKVLDSESQGVKKNIQEQEDLIGRLDEQVPKIRNEKEFAASKSQLEEARKSLGMLEDQMLEIDMKKEELDDEIENIDNQKDNELQAVIDEDDELGIVEDNLDLDINIDNNNDNDNKG